MSIHQGALWDRDVYTTDPYDAALRARHRSGLTRDTAHGPGGTHHPPKNLRWGRSAPDGARVYAATSLCCRHWRVYIQSDMACRGGLGVNYGC
jgi:hypothetical protein